MMRMRQWIVNRMDARSSTGKSLTIGTGWTFIEMYEKVPALAVPHACVWGERACGGSVFVKMKRKAPESVCQCACLSVCVCVCV